MRLGALNPEEPFSGETTLTRIDDNDQRVREVIDSSREKFAIKYVELKPTGKKPIRKAVHKKAVSQATALP